MAGRDLTAGGTVEGARAPRGRGAWGHVEAVMGQLGSHSGVAAAAAGGPSQAEPGAKEARMSSLPSRRAGDGAPSPLLLHPDAAGRGGELLGLPTHQGALDDVEMTWFGVQML